MSERASTLLIHDISDSIHKIRNYIQGMSREDFLADTKTVDAVARNLEIIGEASKRLPEELKQKHPDVPLKNISRMRNKIVHDYFGLDLELIWEVVTHDILAFEKEYSAD